MNTKLFQKNAGIIIASIICAIIIASGIRLKVFANVEELTVNNNKEGSNTYTIKIEKKDCSVSVIKYEPAEGSVIEIEENTGGKEEETGSGEKYYCYRFADHVYDPGARLTVTYTDGSTYTYTADYNETGQRRFVNTSDPNNTNDTIIPIISEKDIQSDNPWQAGGTYHISLSYMGVETTCPVKIVSSDEKAASEAEKIINAMDPADRAGVASARAAYDKLTADQKALVKADVLKKLTDAEESIKNQDKASEVEEIIRTMNPYDKAGVASARAAYDKLTADQKALVRADVLKKLTDAEKTLRDREIASQTPAVDDQVIRTNSASDKPAVNSKYKVGNQTYKILSKNSVGFITANDAKKVIVPDVISIKGTSYLVTTINKNAFSKSKAKSVVIGKNVKKIQSKAFTNSIVSTVTLSTRLLTKKSVKGSLKGSAVKTIKVKVGDSKANKKWIKKYKKYFTNKNAGRKAAVK